MDRRETSYATERGPKGLLQLASSSPAMRNFGPQSRRPPRSPTGMLDRSELIVSTFNLAVMQR